MINGIQILDKRYKLSSGAGSDSIHTNPQYSYAVTQLTDDKGNSGCGLAFTLGPGNELVCEAARFFAQKLVGKDIESLMSNFGNWFKQVSNDQYYRWLGPHKGVVHLGLASVTNACFDLWAKTRKLPLWKLLTELSPEQIANLLDLSYLEDILTRDEVISLVQQQQVHKEERMKVIREGYPGYDTSVGWFNYNDEQIRENCRKAIENGFNAMKLKVGSVDPLRDIHRAEIVREVAGENARVMLDANQQWTIPQAIAICSHLKNMNPYWIEEPTHPDDILGHQLLAREVAPLKLAVGEHIPNRIIFKNYLQTDCASFIQVDALRVGGVSEFITVSLLSKKIGVPVVPHVGDMGQLHQHLVLFNHISLGLEKLFLEYIPHLRDHFVHPARVRNGVYETPMEAGSSCDLRDI